MSIYKPAPPTKPTAAQIRYLEILFNDLGYTWNSRNAFLQHEFSRPDIKHLDDLNNYEASHVLAHLKQIRDSLKR